MKILQMWNQMGQPGVITTTTEEPTKDKIAVIENTDTINIKPCPTTDGSYNLFDTELLPTNWMANGNCTDSHPSVFFPRDGIGVIKAQRICEGCPVADECLEYALTNHISHGVWGGTSERQRRRILSERRRVRREAQLKKQPVPQHALVS